jgi:flavin-dependent dehydrogenase
VVVGGGPAGSACAAVLRAAGRDVIVVDRAAFPRDKVCAGWITPQVIDELRFDSEDYRRTRTFQPITGFRVGIIGARGTARVEYGRPVSFGIRRCEFDHYLLGRSGARLRLGAPVSSIRRDGDRWTIDGAISAPMLVGAGGHFCPVARLLNAEDDRGPLVVAQEVEVPLDPDASDCRIAGETPELYFCDDFSGYGWCFRKGDFLNVGFGRIAGTALPAATKAFVDFLCRAGRLAADPQQQWRWRGHAYLLAGPSGRRLVDSGVLLAGDAAGIAYPQSGEGIRPAIESGLLAAASILAANGDYRASRLAPYAARLRARFAAPPLARLLAHAIPARVPAAAGRWLLNRGWFVREVVLDRWFLHARTPAVTLP